MATTPTVSTAASALTPGSGSARRAVPIGISGDAATATAAAPRAPAAAATPTSSSPAAISWPRVIPNAASTGLAGCAAAISRAAACPTTISAAIASTRAKSASEITSGRIDRSTAAACAPSSATNTCPRVAGKRCASASAWRPAVPGLYPGRSFTYAPSKPMYPGPSRRTRAVLARTNGTLSRLVTGRTDPRVTMTPTTRSLIGRPWAAFVPGDAPARRALMASVLPTCRCSARAPFWSTAISPGRAGSGSRPASTLGISSTCPQRRSSGAAATADRTSRPLGPVGSTFNPTTGATTAALGSRARAA
jgi:hypothetical protein